MLHVVNISNIYNKLIFTINLLPPPQKSWLLFTSTVLLSQSPGSYCPSKWPCCHRSLSCPRKIVSHYLRYSCLSNSYHFSGSYTHMRILVSPLFKPLTQSTLETVLSQAFIVAILPSPGLWACPWSSVGTGLLWKRRRYRAGSREQNISFLGLGKWRNYMFLKIPIWKWKYVPT